MPNVEISEEDLRKNTQMRDMLTKMLANPKARELVQQATKIVSPETVIPEVEQRETIANTLADVRKTVDDFVKGQTEREAKAQADAETARIRKRMDDGFGRLRASGVTEEGIKEVEKLMEAEGLVNPEVAWSHFEKLHPPAQPVLSSGQSWNFAQVQTDTSDDIKKLIESRGDNNQVLDKMARDALNEIRGVSRR